MTAAISRAASQVLADPRWAQVCARDPEADGRFYFSVASTGIYCRPSCPARRPRPENVRFHVTAADAEAAGFRPCRRCRPNEAETVRFHADRIAEICRWIERAEELPKLDEMARRAGLSPWHFHRLFKRVTGLTPRAYGAAHRAGRLRKELRRSASVTAAIFDAGFNSSSRFYEKSDQVLGMKPSTFRSGGEAVEIRFAVGECSLGAILVACTDRGVCAIALGNDPDRLVRDLQDRFPRSCLVGGDSKFEKLVARVVGFVEAPGTGLDLPLDVRGTAFQQRVWEAIRKIPPGSTASYAEIARRLGSPQSARAVSRACASNNIAVAIPCHRVVRSDGDLAGYRWGVERKRTLLERESRALAAH